MSTALAALLAYLVLQLAIGVWASRRVRSEADYLVAGRSLGYPLAIFSTFATWFGAETIVGAAGSTYREGLSLASAEPFGYALCLILMGLVFAVPLWRRGMTTLADLFRQRFSPGVERLAAIILIPSSLLWAAAQVRAFGAVVSTAVPEMDVASGILLAAAFVVLYTAVGGLLADAVTDLLQGILLLVGLVVVASVAVQAAGGLAALPDALRAADAARAGAPGSHVQGSRLDVLEAWAIPVLGSVLATELVARVIAARSPAVARSATVAAGMMYLLVGMLPVLVGLLGPVVVPPLQDGELLVPTVAATLLPTIGYALFAGALVSALLSTADSTLLVASGLLSHNLLVPLLGITAERRKVLLARGGVLVFGGVACLLALSADGVFALVEQASAFGSAGVLVCVGFGLFSRFGGSRAAASTLLGGLVAYLAFSALDTRAPFLASVGISLTAYVTVSAAEVVAARKR